VVVLVCALAAAHALRRARRLADALVGVPLLPLCGGEGGGDGGTGLVGAATAADVSRTPRVRLLQVLFGWAPPLPRPRRRPTVCAGDGVRERSRVGVRSSATTAGVWAMVSAVLVAPLLPLSEARAAGALALARDGGAVGGGAAGGGVVGGGAVGGVLDVVVLLPLGEARAAGDETSVIGRFTRRSPIGTSVVTLVVLLVLPLDGVRAGVGAEAEAMPALLPLVEARAAGAAAATESTAEATVVRMVVSLLLGGARRRWCWLCYYCHPAGRGRRRRRRGRRWC
jgi:hypothetical protein